MTVSGLMCQVAARLSIAVALIGLCGPEAWSAPFAYIPNYGSNNVSVIDIASNTVVATIATGGVGPNAVAVTPDGTKVFVTNQNPAPIGALNNGSMAEINGTTNTFVATTAIHYYPMSVAVNAAGTTAYVPANGGLAAGSVIVPPEVDVINTAAHTYSAIPMTASGAIALTPGETFAYVTGRFSANLYLLNLTTNTLVTGAGFPITVGFNPLAVAISPGGFAYVANSTDGTVSVVNTATNTVVATIPVGTNPQSIAVNPAGTLVYVANNGSNTVSVIDTATNAVVGAPIAVGNHPYGVSVSPGGNLIYVANQFENTVSVIAELTRAAQGPGIPVGTQPTALGKFIKSAAPAVAPPTRLAVYIGPPPTVGLPFLVAVQSQDANANPQSVAANTAVTVSRTTGTGTVGGTANCTILAGASSCLLAAATYSVAETGVVLTATRTSGDMLPPGNSMPFRVLPVGPAKLAVASVNGGANPTMGLAFPVVVQSTDNSGAPVNVIVATNVTLSRTGGSGTLGGTLTCTIAAASNSCTAAGVTYSKAEYGVTITATRTAGDPVAAATSAPFTVNSLASPTNRLVVLSVNGGVSPATNTTFNVAIQAQNASGTPVNVVASTGVVLVTKTGTGLLQGSRVCTINAGTNSCTATANYNVASGTESGVVLNAQRNGGDPLGAGDSAPFTVTAASPVPAKLFAFAFLGGPIGSSTPAVGVPFQVGISSADAGGTPASVAVATPVSLAVSAGTGTLGGTVGCTILAGNNGCTASPTYSQVDTGVVLTASGGGLTPGSTSPAFNVVAASPPTKLAILPVDFFDDPRVGIPFSVDVRSADASGNFQLVQSATAVTLSRTAGTGTLGGTLTCTIPAGSSQCLFTNVTYTVAEANVVLTATRTSGDSLATGASSAFTVSAMPPPPTKLAITIPNANSNVAGFAFSLIIATTDAGNTNRAVTQATQIALTVGAGTGALSGNTGCTISPPNSTCSIAGIKYSRPESGVVITATRTSGDALTPVSSAPFDIGAAPPMPPSKFVFTSINGGASPVANTTFDIVLQTQDSSGTPQSVFANTDVALTVNTGTGVLNGAVTCTIPANANSCIVVGARYSKAEAGVVLTATRTTGDVLPPGNSAPFNVSSTAGALRIADVDANGAYEPLADGLLVLRYLFSITGNALTAGAIGANSTRSLPADIVTYLDGARTQFDIDGNGTTAPLTDGLLLIRYMFSLRGDALINGAVTVGAPRSTALDIETYIQTTLMP